MIFILKFRIYSIINIYRYGYRNINSDKKNIIDYQYFCPVNQTKLYQGLRLQKSNTDFDKNGILNCENIYPMNKNKILSG